MAVTILVEEQLKARDAHWSEILVVGATNVILGGIMVAVAGCKFFKKDMAPPRFSVVGIQALVRAAANAPVDKYSLAEGMKVCSIFYDQAAKAAKGETNDWP